MGGAPFLPPRLTLERHMSSKAKAQQNNEGASNGYKAQKISNAKQTVGTCGGAFKKGDNERPTKG